MAMRLIASLVRKEVIFYVKVQGNPAASINHRALGQTDCKFWFVGTCLPLKPVHLC